jgi:uncharacterized coiled-coil DUF342 family protein
VDSQLDWITPRFLRCRRGNEDTTISNTHSNAYDFERLERAIASLTSEHLSLRGENEVLREELAQRESHIQKLDEQFIGLNQRRQDALKRIDELIAQIDHLAAASDDSASEVS